MRYAMIMAGGAGTRLWPMSRKDRPKQLLKFIHRREGAGGGAHPSSLLELAAGRVDGLIAPERVYICTGEAYRRPIREALPGFGDDQILGEPMGRDTVNAVGFAAAVFQKLDPDAVFCVLTADHIIEPQEDFQRLMDLGFRLVETDPSRLVTFSIKPTYPATGYGYVERGAPIAETGKGGVEGAVDASGRALAFRVARFFEKPELPRAQAFVQSGHFGWNSGMFVWKAATVMECLKRFVPASYEGLVKIQEAWGTLDQEKVLAEVYPTLPKTSVDYAIMEPATKLPPNDRQVSVCTVLMDVSWLDVGSWPSYGETLEAGADGNKVSGGGALVVNGTGNLVVNAGHGHTVAVLGVDNMIVVHTPDATLVMPAGRAEELKHLHAKVDPRLH
jgi:mannose-1-phosphate guanylyltransferase